MTHSIELDEEELQTIGRAARSVKLWRYGKWVQVLSGLFLLGFSFWLIHEGHGRGSWGGIPHFVFGAFGGPLVIQAFVSNRFREQRLLLKLYEAQGDT
ncbi:hypothetical protein ELE36_11890 [Pseudolysobacter antarcticus]|uniref:2TM domain-containing protein n=1 Tax=Pseudolysobacter antarcticus TaxID=2511995 RepID=A0A411HKG8_9GAMM|nr:hypothetical protein [Pseudolysobacter antarcticus]QBB70993.1 hypothetical protein ELE36_11890 [Pseudolysobacter antarcticus]